MANKKQRKKQELSMAKDESQAWRELSGRDKRKARKQARGRAWQAA